MEILKIMVEAIMCTKIWVVSPCLELAFLLGMEIQPKGPSKTISYIGPLGHILLGSTQSESRINTLLATLLIPFSSSSSSRQI